MWWINKVGALLASVCVGAHTHIATNSKSSELYIGAISDKLRGGFVINHKYANLAAERIAWSAAAGDLGVLLQIVETRPEAALACATLQITLSTNQLTARVKGHRPWLFIYSLFGAINGSIVKNKWFLFFSMCHVGSSPSY